MVIVVPAEPRHVDALATLLEELDRYYGATELEPREQRMEHIQEALFGDAPAATVLLAWDGDQLVGMASYSFLWPAAGMTRSLFLKELYIAQPYRRRGIGKRLMETILRSPADTPAVGWSGRRTGRAPARNGSMQSWGCQSPRTSCFTG